MDLEPIITENAPAALGPYSQGIKVGDLIFTSGQIPVNMNTGKLESEDIYKATKFSMNNLKEVLKEAGSELNQVVKIFIYLKSMEDFDEVNRAYGEYFTDIKPARSCAEVNKLPKDARIMIEAIAKVK